jgi:hypothetical protein
MNPTPIEMLKLTPVSSRAALLPLPEGGSGFITATGTGAPVANRACLSWARPSTEHKSRLKIRRQIGIACIRELTTHHSAAPVR